MAIASSELDALTITFRKAVRENTGRHMLDSGGAYGRGHERELIADDSPVLRIDVSPNYDGTATDLDVAIETGAWLDHNYEIDRNLQRQWQDWDADHEDLNWFESGEQFATEVLGMKQMAHDNIYNHENDLTQVFVWAIFAKPDISIDWFYADEDDTITIFYMHTGCDVRGGYGRPIFARKKTGEGNYLPDPYVGVYADAVITPGEGPIADRRLEDDLYERFPHWEIGYSSAPFYSFMSEVVRVFGFTYDKEAGTVVVQLEDEQIVKVGFTFGGEWE